MGGGGAMRAATKVATFGVAAGLRGAGGASLSSSSSSLLTTPPPRGGGAPSGSIVSDAARASSFSPIQRPRPPPPMDDDWEFAEEEEEEEEYLLPAPRLVFGGVPTYEEAKDATSELKDAVHKEYFSNDKAVVHSSVPKPIFQAFSLLTQTPEAQDASLEAKRCSASQRSRQRNVRPGIEKLTLQRAAETLQTTLVVNRSLWPSSFVALLYQGFCGLSSSFSRSWVENIIHIPEEKELLGWSDLEIYYSTGSLVSSIFPGSKGVVASLASDKNVWDAVMKNEKVMDFIKWQQTSSVSDIDANIEQPFPENNKDSQKSSSEEEEESSGNELLKFVEKVKMTVTDMVSSLSGFFQSLFGVENNNNGISIDENGNASVKTGIGASFMALAVMAIMVAVLKRA